MRIKNKQNWERIEKMKVIERITNELVIIS